MAKKGPIGIGIIGLGRAGYAMHVRELRGLEGFRIVAGCDVLPERTQQLAQEFGARPYARHEDLLADKDVELVAVATRSDTHAEIGVACLRAGKHTVVEKPMALNLAEADRLVRAARTSRGKLLVRHNMRCEPAFVHVKEVIESGLLGKVFEIRLCRHSYNRRDDWQTLRKYGGGLLNNWGPHLIDTALQYLGGKVASVHGELKRLVCAGDADDYVKIVLKGKSGCIVDIEVSGAVALGEPHYRVMGTLGALTCDSRESRIRWYDPAAAPALALHPETPPQNHSYGNRESLPWQEKTVPAAPAEPVADFYEVVRRTLREGRPFPVTVAQARQVVWVADQVRKGTRFERRARS